MQQVFLMRLLRLIFLLAAIIYLHTCSANQDINNEQCINPSNPQFNQTIPWRVAIEAGSNLNLPNDGLLILVDTTGCVSFQLSFFSYEGTYAIATNNYAWAILSGTLTDNCRGGVSYSVYGRQYVNYPLYSVDSIAIQRITFLPVYITGTYANGTVENDFSFAIEAANYYSNRKPYYKVQRDEFYTFRNSSCTWRLRGDTGGNYLYSQPYKATMVLSSGPQLEFTFPANIQMAAYYYPSTNYYHECPCDVNSINLGSAVTTLPTMLPLPQQM